MDESPNPNPNPSPNPSPNPNPNQAAVNAKSYPLASVVLGAMGSLAAAAGAACFAADAEAVVAPLVSLLLQHRPMLAEVNPNPNPEPRTRTPNPNPNPSP